MFIPKLWTRAFGLFKKIPIEAACMVLFLSALFMALPSRGFVDLVRADWYWGCPRFTYWVGHSIDGDSRGFAWNYLIFDLVFWIIYFSLLGFAVSVVLRKIRVRIRPIYSLCIIGAFTVVLYVHFYRPDRFINAVTGGYLGFLESRPKQLNQAIRFGDVETAQMLLKNYPGLVFSNDITGRTPLHEAAYWGQSGMAKLLLTYGARVDIKDRDKQTPLFLSALNGWLSTTELLLKNGAEVNIKSWNGETPLLLAAEYGNNRVVELLLANKADVNVKANDGSTPLLEAAAGGHEKTVQLLIASNAQINVTNQYGTTPLQIALSNGCTNVVELLRQHGASDN
jgi:ankyrin repeat protein